MSGLADRLRAPRERIARLPRPHRRLRPAGPIEVDGRPTARERVWGLGSVFGKSLRDSRRAILLGGVLMGLLVLVTASQVAAQFGTAIARAQMAALPAQLPPIFRGLLGEPIGVERLGGFLSWRTLNFLPIILGGWSIMALSGAIASEARRGSLDLVLSTPRTRTAVALQKAAAHVVAAGIATLAIALLSWAGGAVFATLPGDSFPLVDALAHGAWLWAMTILPGSVAWLLAPVIGRGAAAGFGALVMVASFVATGYRESLPLFEALDGASYFGWTAGHRPLAGAWDWPSVGLVAALAALLLVVGAVLFRTRDVGITLDVGLPLPRLRLGLGGPLGRSFAERLSVAVWWGLGLGLLGLVYAANAESFISALRTIPQFERMAARFYPDVDIFSPGGILQLVFFGFGTLLIAAAAGMLAAGWASDESEKRLEAVLSAPVGRLRWAIETGVGVLGAVLVLTVIVAALVVAGVVASGGSVVTPIAGVFVMGLYAAALVGIGLAVGGLVRPGLAGPVAAGLGVTFYLLDTLGVALQLPDPILQLSLSSHLGQPMAGSFDVAGIATCAGLALGGIAVAARGLGGRDIGR